MLWACVHFPLLPLEALGNTAADGVPGIVAEGPAANRRVLRANSAAQAAGIHSGQPLASAQLACPRLLVHARDPAAEARHLDALAAVAYRYSSRVSLVDADSLVLEVGASLRLFDGWPALERHLRADCAALGHVHRIALAPTASAAHAFARWRGGCAFTAATPFANALAAIPLEHSGLDAATVALLRGIGCGSLRDVFRLPRAELTRRTGTAALEHLDRLRGLRPEPLPSYRPPQGYAGRIDFDDPVDHVQALTFPLGRLVRELASVLIARDGGVQRFDLVLGHGGGAMTRAPVGFLQPQRDAAELLTFARMRLERTALAAPVHALGLDAPELPPLAPLHEDLFDASRRQALDWPQLVERLRARLGDAALQVPVLVADHRPERAGTHVGAAPSTIAAPVPPAPRPRPFWLLPRPRPLRPAPRRILAGPERIESGWWDGADQRRDYYVVETGDGQRAWAFLPRDANTGWMLHGWFA